MRVWQVAAVGLACAIAYGCGDDDDSASNNTAGSGGTAGSAGAAGGDSQAGASSGGTNSGGHAGTNGNGGTLNMAGQPGSNMAGAPAGGASGGESPGLGGAGATGVGGAADAGGAGGAPSAQEIQQICSGYAAFYKKVAAATSCPDGSATVKSSCIQGYATNKCVDEAAAYFACVKDLPNSDFQCVNNVIAGKAGVCTAVTATYVACASK